MSTALQLIDLSRTFGRVHALASVSLELGEATSTALMGPNGAGKTTLLRICATLLKPTSGKILIDGLDPREEGPAVRKRLAVLGHDSALYPDLSAVENLQFAARLHRFDGSGIENALDRVGLHSAARRPVRTFSRGMQQRCAIARVLLQRPRLLLLDEPSTGLDLGARDIFHEIVAELRASGTTVLLTTHDVAEARLLSQSATLMARGRITWSGPTDGALGERLEALAAAGRD